MQKIFLLLIVLFSLTFASKKDTLDLLPEFVNLDSVGTQVVAPDTESLPTFTTIGIYPRTQITAIDDSCDTSVFMIDSGGLIISPRTAYKASYYKNMYLLNTELYSKSKSLYSDMYDKATRAQDFYKLRIKLLEDANKRTFMERHGFWVGFIAGIIIIVVPEIIVYKLSG